MSAATNLAARRSPLSPPGRAPARRPHLRVVPEPRHTLRYLVAFVAIAGVGVFGVVGLNALAAEQAFAARALEGEVRELSLRYDELSAEIASLESPARVRAVAMGQLGMVPAERPAFLLAGQAVPGDTDFAAHRGTLRGTEVGMVADPVKAVLGSGR